MQRWITIALAVLIASLAARVGAEEAPDEPTSPAAELAALERLLDEPVYGEDWSLDAPAATGVLSAGPGGPMDDLEFQNSGLARMSGVRSVSLLTLLRSRETRLFLGVNEEGLVGIHLRAAPRQGEDQNLELARMPWVDDGSVAETADNVTDHEPKEPVAKVE